MNELTPKTQGKGHELSNENENETDNDNDNNAHGILPISTAKTKQKYRALFALVSPKSDKNNTPNASKGNCAPAAQRCALNLKIEITTDHHIIDKSSIFNGTANAKNNNHHNRTTPVPVLSRTRSDSVSGLENDQIQDILVSMHSGVLNVYRYRLIWCVIFLFVFLNGN